MEPARRQQIQAWMIRFADGDRSAFQPLFDALWPVLLAFASRASQHAGDGEDAAQEALLKVFSRIADFDRTRDGVSWALGIAGFEVMTLRKQRSRRRESGADPLQTLAHDESSLEERAITAELQRAVIEMVGELPERDRVALSCALSGQALPKDETSRKRRFRALARLRAAWRRAHG